MTAPAEESEKIITAAKKQLVFRRAAAVALTSVENKAADSSNPINFITYSRQIAEFKRIVMNAELELLELIQLMDERELETTLLSIFDREGNGIVSVHEVLSRLGKVERNEAYADSLCKTMNYLRKKFDSNHNLNHIEFHCMLKGLAGSFGSDYSYVAEILVVITAFSESGDFVLENHLENSVHNESMESSNSMEIIENAVMDARTFLLFELLERDNNGEVDFNNVVRPLFRFIKSIDPEEKLAVSNLLVIDNQSNRRMSYDDFDVFIHNTLAAAPSQVKFHDLANAFTSEAIKIMQTCESVKSAVLEGVFLGNDLKNSLNDLGHSEEKENEVAATLVDYGRMTRLFDLWDLDHSGKIGLPELLLGLRKFEEAKKINSTVEECIKVMNKFDKNNDGELDKKEFASLLVHFTKAISVPLHELIDFMVVQSALRDNTEDEIKNLDSLYQTARDQHRVMKHQEGKSGTRLNWMKQHSLMSRPMQRLTMTMCRDLSFGSISEKTSKV